MAQQFPPRVSVFAWATGAFEGWLCRAPVNETSADLARLSPPSVRVRAPEPWVFEAIADVAVSPSTGLCYVIDHVANEINVFR